MSTPDILYQSLRAGVFENMAQADQAVQNLMSHGFTKDQIIVLCSGESRERYFREFQTKVHKEIDFQGEVATGAALGATVGGLAAIAVGLFSGAIPLVVAGAAGIAGGSGMGAFMGAMMTPGVQDEFAKFYQEQLDAGHLVVVVEDHSAESEARLEQADEILKAAHPLVEAK